MIAPKSPKDLALAPVAAEIDANVQRLRGKSFAEIDHALQLELDMHRFTEDRSERAEHILAFATRLVDLHGWDAEITQDGSAVRISGGSVSLDIALGSSVEAFIEGTKLGL